MFRPTACLFVLLLGAALVGQPLEAWAFYYSQPYFPENRYELDAQGRRYRWQPPRGIYLNTASLQELLALPNVSDNEAIQLLKHRPYRSLKELERLQPTLPLSRIRQLQQSLASQVLLTPAPVLIQGVKARLPEALAPRNTEALHRRF